MPSNVMVIGERIEANEIFSYERTAAARLGMTPERVSQIVKTVMRCMIEESLNDSP